MVCILKLAFGIALQCFAVQALAYVGPAALGGIGALIGVIVAVLITIGVILVLPVRILYRKYKLRRMSAEGEREG